MIYDLEYLKEIGCNMVRVHIKTHPRRWYYHCDRLGLLVWQDFVCMRKFDHQIADSAKEQWKKEQYEMVDALFGHPSIVMWIIFNEAWSQFDTPGNTSYAEQYDPTRLISNASGWTDYGVGDVHDMHDYSFSPIVAMGEGLNDRAAFIGELGGHNVYIDGHMWPSANPREGGPKPLEDRGRETYASGEEWFPRYQQFIAQIQLLQKYGCNGAVYTQITDLEHECNGWLTYDRKVKKVPSKELKSVHEAMYQEFKEGLIATDAGGNFRYTTGKASPGWKEPGFDDRSWKAVRGTNSPEHSPLLGEKDDGKHSYARLEFDYDAQRDQSLGVRLVGHGEYAIYLNGVLIKNLSSQVYGGFEEPTVYPATAFVLQESDLDLLKKVGNVFAIEMAPVAPKRGFGEPSQTVWKKHLLLDLELVEFSM